MMKFINFTAMTESGLTKSKSLLEENPYIEVIKFDYTMIGGQGVGILYKDRKSF